MSKTTAQKSITQSFAYSEFYTPPCDFSDQFTSFNVRVHSNFSLATVSDGRGHSFDVRKNVDGLAAVMDHHQPMLYMPFYGQSNVFEGGSLGVEFGEEAFPHSCLTYAHSPRAGGNVLADESEFVDLRAMTDGPRKAQTLATMAGFAYEYIHRTHMRRTSSGYFGFTSWHGGQPISQFEKGMANYENVLIGARNARPVARKYGRDIDCKFFTFVQGESATSNYLDSLERLAGGLSFDLADALNITDAPKCVILQINNADTASTASGVELDQFSAAANNSNIILAGPMYSAPFEPVNDEIHQGPIGRMVLGEVLAACYIEIIKNGDFVPFQPKSVDIAGDTITIEYTDTGVGLKIDDDWVLPVSNYGFKLLGDPTVSISSFNVKSNRTLEIKLTGSPSGALELEYALTSDTANDNWAGGRGQIYSQSEYKSFFHSEGYEVPEYVRHYCPRFRMAVPSTAAVSDDSILDERSLIASFVFDTANSTLDNGEIVSFEDRSGNGGKLSALSTVRRADLLPNQINGLEAAQFKGWTANDGASDAYVLETPGFITSNPCAAVVFYKPSDAQDGDTVFGSFANSAKRFIMNTPDGSGSVNFAYGTSIVSAPYVVGEWDMAILSYDGTHIRIFSGGVWSGPVVATGSSGGAPMVFGALNTRGAQGGDFFAREFNLYDDDLFKNTQAVADLKKYANEKYGI